MNAASSRLPLPYTGSHLFYGDNLEILRNHIADESVDLIYLDPPFNSQASYNVLFRAPSGEQSKAQIQAFGDTWNWANAKAEDSFDQVMQSGNTDVAEMLRAIRMFLKENDMMAYLTMMAIRLLELHRVLKPTGSLYLHCDPTASHYLKILLDAVFGKDRFVNEIVWKRYGAHNDVGQGSTHYGRVQDVILFYSKSKKRTWHQLYTPFEQSYIDQRFTYKDPDGRRYMDTPLTGPGGAENGNPVYSWNGHTRAWRISAETMQEMHDAGKLHYTKTGYVRGKLYLDTAKGVPIQSLWTDIAPLAGRMPERLDYPTQKPVALLERILQASSKPGDVVLDPFCGCGTTIHAAERLGRKWIGIDITHLAISLIEKRLNDAFPTVAYTVHGTPKDVDGAKALSAQDKYQFQWWAVSLVDAVPYGGKKKGADGGVDGHIYFKPDGKTTEKAIVSVKGGGNVGVAMIKDLITTVQHEKAKIGVFITLTPPTGPMKVEAAKAGFYEPPYHAKVPRIQILTIDDLFAGKKPQMPFVDMNMFKKADKDQVRHPSLF